MKPIGHADGYLFAIVLWQSMILSVLGSLPGARAVAGGLPHCRDATRLPPQFCGAQAAIVYGLTVVMCMASGGLAMRRRRDADPPEIF